MALLFKVGIIQHAPSHDSKEHRSEVHHDIPMGMRLEANFIVLWDASKGRRRMLRHGEEKTPERNN